MAQLTVDVREGEVLVRMSTEVLADMATRTADGRRVTWRGVSEADGTYTLHWATDEDQGYRDMRLGEAVRTNMHNVATRLERALGAAELAAARQERAAAQRADPPRG